MKKQTLFSFAVFLGCFVPVLAYGQGVFIPPKITLGTVNGITRPIANATITVCAANTAGIPCSPALANALFKDSALTVPLANPTQADANGNWPQMAIAGGNYTITESGAGFAGFSQQITVSCAPGGACSVTALNATSATITGALTAGSVNGVVYCDNQTGADIGAKCNAAFATLGGNYGTVRISAPGSYLFSTTIAFTAPASLECAPGVVLNYTGSGKAIKMGPDGLVFATADPHPYVVRGCTITGGSTWTHGIYFNTFVIKSYVQDTWFINAGNTTTYNIFYQSQNWDSTLQDVYMWNIHSQPCYNGVALNGYNTDNTTADNGVSFLYALRVHIQHTDPCNTTGMLIDGSVSVVEESNIEGFNPNIRVRRWGSNFTVDNTHMEVTSTTAGACSIQYGDIASDPTASLGTYITGLTVTKTSINVHNSSFTTTAHPICNANSSTGLANAILDNVFAMDLTAGQPVVVQPTNINQFGNHASNTTTTTTNGYPSGNAFGIAVGANLHTQNGNIAPWDGTDGEVYNMWGAQQIHGIDANNNSILANNGRDAQNNVVIQAGATADQDENLIFNSHTGTINGRVNMSTASLMKLVVGATNTFQVSTLGVFPQLPMQSGGTIAGFTGTGACATITTTAGGAFAGTGKCTGTTGASTLTITFSLTATNGYVCDVWDETTRANVFQQTSHTQTTCVLTVTSVTQNDVFVFKAIAF